MVGLNAKVRELPVLFGKNASLVGILTEASQAALVEDAPGVILLNAGIVHRVGPNRMYVTLARALAKAGYTTLRFDQSGIGDSPNRLDALPPLESALSDVREAVDWLAANKSLHRVILMGLCAGADHSVLYANSDPRVVGIALFDPTIPRTRRFHLNAVRKRLFRLVNKPPAQALDSIANLSKRVLRSIANTWQRNPQAHDDNGKNESEAIEPTLDDNQLRDMFEDHYRRCVQSNVKILALFTGGVPGCHNYREQIVDAFPGVTFGDRLTLEYASQSDHAFSSEADRALLLQCVLSWLQMAAFTRADGRNSTTRSTCP
jgi:dienelactone hydrolase